MDDFKISLFESEYKTSFPAHRALTKNDCKNIIDKIYTKYNINSSNIEAELASMQSFYQDANAMNNFKLMDTLTKMNVSFFPEVFINWYKFVRVDAFNIADLDKYFYDIWFSSSDDIDVFDESLSWIVSIRHDGCITFLN